MFEAGFKGLSNEERVFHTARLRRAEERRKKDWKENLPAYMQMMSSVIIVAILVFGYADFSETKIELDRSKQLNKELQIELVDKIIEIQQGVQRLEGVKGTSNKEAPD